ncbi:MAG: type II toxin-antitoxin system RelB/DinJ family antitoxin [Peptococcaceae bacterium]|jgi:addiction module RelB/DinJ family antitoxin|nr:type II toxin-antitoxin system RelB/DinJ family antitoxin [Peptococcaceae bacterium]
MDKEVKERLVEVLDNLGMNLSTGVNVWAKAVIRHGGFPFEIADPHVLARLENDRLSSRQKAAVRTFVKNVNTIEDEPLDEEFDAILNQKTSIVRQLDV